MAQDFMTTWFQNNTSLPGTYRPQDAYLWLEDSDDETEKLKAKAHHIPRSAFPFSSNDGSPATLNDLRNTNGKRAFHETTAASNDPRAKRMRIENVQREAVASNGQVRPSVRPRTIDLSVSPPPPMRSTGHGQQQQNVPPRQVPSSTGRPHSLQQHHYTTKPPSIPSHARDPFSTVTTQRSTPTAPVSRPRAPHPPQTPAPPLTIKEEECVPTSFPAKTRTASGPFMVDDSSDDEQPAKPVQKPQPAGKPNNPGAPRRTMTRVAEVRPQISSADRERQLLESRQRRQEATERKRETPSSLGVPDEDCKKHGDEMEIGMPRTVATNSPAVPSVPRPSLETLHQALPKAPPPARESVIDLTYSNGATTAPRAARTPGPATSHGQAADQEYQRAKAYVEAKRKKEAERLAQTQALEEKQRKEVQARKAAEIKKQVEINEQQRSRAQMQAEYDKQAQNRAEAAQRSLAIVDARRKLEAQKKLDAQKEAQAKRVEQEKRRLEQQKWDERTKVEDQQREVLRKRQAEMEKEKTTMDNRQAALARLSAVRPPQPAPRPITQAAVGGTDVNEVVAKHTAPQDLHFKDGDGSSAAADAARKKVKEIQDRNAQAGVQQALPEPQMSERDRRIKAVAERNLRLREAEEREAKAGADEEDHGLVLENDDRSKPKRDSRAPTPTSPTLPKGPQSLSSAAGQALLAGRSTNNDSKPTSSSRPAPEKNSRDYHSSHYRRQLSEVLPEDIQVVQWRDTGMRFQDVAVLFEKSFGVAKNFDTHRKRYRQVKEALREAGLDGDGELLDAMVGGSQEARERVNQAVHGRWPLEEVVRGGGGGGDEERVGRQKAQANERQRNAKGHFLPVPERPAGRNAAPTPKPAGPARNLNSSFESSTTDGTLAREEDGARPTTGGKTMNEQTFMYYLECLAEAQAEDAPEPATPREQSPIGEDDYCHFAYQVQRREMTQKELDDGFDLDDDPWQVCDDPFDNLAQANAKASKEALTMPKKWKKVADSDREYDISSRTLKNGRRMFTVNWEGAGRVQTCVARYTRYHQDGVLPTSKDGWAPKTIWHVRERTTIKSGDDMFSEAKESDTTKSIDNAVYTTLDQANEVAVKHFVSIAFSPTSANLNMRAMEVQDAEERLLEELGEQEVDEEDEGPVFRREIGDEEGGRRVVVWVEEGELRGPRNL